MHRVGTVHFFLPEQKGPKNYKFATKDKLFNVDMGVKGVSGYCRGVSGCVRNVYVVFQRCFRDVSGSLQVGCRSV